VRQKMKVSKFPWESLMKTDLPKSWNFGNLELFPGWKFFFLNCLWSTLSNYVLKILIVYQSFWGANFQLGKNSFCNSIQEILHCNFINNVKKQAFLHFLLKKKVCCVLTSLTFSALFNPVRKRRFDVSQSISDASKSWFWVHDAKFFFELVHELPTSFSKSSSDDSCLFL